MPKKLAACVARVAFPNGASNHPWYLGVCLSNRRGTQPASPNPAPARLQGIRDGWDVRKSKANGTRTKIKRKFLYPTLANPRRRRPPAPISIWKYLRGLAQPLRTATTKALPPLSETL